LLQRAVSFARLQEMSKRARSSGLFLLNPTPIGKVRIWSVRMPTSALSFKHIFGGSVIGDRHVDFFTFYRQQQVGLGIVAQNLWRQETVHWQICHK
jgi:hypothetical protein